MIGGIIDTIQYAKLVQKYLEQAKNASIKELNDLATRAEIEANILLSQAKVEQELAIANRIVNSDEVEIEEFYDASGQGNIGLSNQDEKMTLGLSGEGRRVTKRIIKFKGNKIEQDFTEK